MDSQPRWLVADAVRALRERGFSIGQDKLARLKPFGISSQRDGRLWYLSRDAFAQLEFLLLVEKGFGFQRDWDGLAFELALLKYPVIPWERIAEGSRKRMERVLNQFNVAIHQISDFRGTELWEHEIASAARSLVGRFIKPRMMRDSPSLRIMHDLLRHLFEMLLRVAYTKGHFEERHVRQFLFAIGFPDSFVDGYLALTVSLLESLRPLLFVSSDNMLISWSNDSPEDTSQLQTDIDDARMLLDLMNRQALSVFVPNVKGLAIESAFPELGWDNDLNIDAPFVHGLRTAVFCMMLSVKGDEKAALQLEQYRRGDVAIVDSTIDGLVIFKKALPTMLRLKYGDNT